MTPQERPYEQRTERVGWHLGQSDDATQTAMGEWIDRLLPDGWRPVGVIMSGESESAYLVFERPVPISMEPIGILNSKDYGG
jgi:hypothetical protein